LGKIIEATECSLVISSTWRKEDVPATIVALSDETDYFNNGMKFPFCDRIIGVTDLLHCDRGLEIARWIKENNYKGKYVILDDMDEMLKEQKPYFIMTDLWKGLTVNDVEKAIKILNK